MATHEEIAESLRTFQESYQKNQQLKMMNRDWNRVILIKATDIPSEHTLILKDGELMVKEGGIESPDLTVTADSDTIADLFFGDITPTEPYLNGSLKIFGSEDDIIRLDFISLMIWGE